VLAGSVILATSVMRGILTARLSRAQDIIGELGAARESRGRATAVRATTAVLSKVLRRGQRRAVSAAGIRAHPLAPADRTPHALAC